MGDVTESIYKAGFAGDDASHAVFLPMVVRPEMPDIVDDRDLEESSLGDDAQDKQGVLTLKNPIEPVLYLDFLERTMPNLFAKEDDRQFPESQMEPEMLRDRFASEYVLRVILPKIVGRSMCEVGFAGTLTTIDDANGIAGMKYSVSLIMKMDISPKNKKYLQKLIKCLKKSTRSWTRWICTTPRRMKSTRLQAVVRFMWRFV